MTSFHKALPILASALILGQAAPLTAAQITISGTSSQPARIICDRSPEVIEMGRYLRDFLTERQCPAILVTDGRLDASSSATQLVFATASSLARLAPSVKEPKFAKNSRDEAFLLDVSRQKKGTVVLLVGKSIPGVRAAAARFVSRIANDGKQLTMITGREQCDPFIKLRVFSPGNSARRQTPKTSPFKKNDLETWAIPKVRAYPELFWQFGFNGVQLGECRGYGSMPDSEMGRIRSVHQAFFKGAKDHHMFTSMFMWGDALFDEFETFSWNNPTERKVMRLFQKDLAQDYGAFMDHIIVHVGDPGGCSRDGCDLYKTPQQITASALAEFRKVNPKTEATLSTWANSYFWKKSPKRIDMSNYGPMFPGMASQTEYNEPIPDGAKFMDSSFMPKDVGIAMNRNYNEQQADMICANGRTADVWSWYIGDNEMINTYWFTMQHIDAMLSKMPDKARDQIRMETHELCWHGWPQIIDAYVGAQKLWNPRKPLAPIEREFCVAAFGPQNAKAALSLYHAVENGWNQAIPIPANWGTSEYNNQLTKVLQQASSIKFPAGWKPNFAFPVPVKSYLEMLTARVKLMRAVSEAKRQVDATRRRLNVGVVNKAKSLALNVTDSAGSTMIGVNGMEIPIRLEPGMAVGATFRAIKDFSKLGILCCTWSTNTSGLTLSLYDAPGGKLLAQRVVTNQPDNAMAWLETKQLSGTFYLEVSNPTGTDIGVYGSITGSEGSSVLINRQAIPDEPAEIMQIKLKLIGSLPNLPIDPMYKMDASIVNPGYTTLTFAQMIERL